MKFLFILLDYEKLEIEVATFKTLKTAIEKERLTVLKIVLNYETLLALNTGISDKSVGKNEALFLKNASKFPDTVCVGLCINYITIFFFACNFDKVVKLNKKMQQFSIREDLTLLGIVLSILGNYELGNLSLIDFQFGAICRKYELNKFYDLFLKCIKTLINTPGSERNALLVFLKEDLVLMQQKDRHIYGMDEVMIW
jgi:hypothetical protein